MGTNQQQFEQLDPYASDYGDRVKALRDRTADQAATHQIDPSAYQLPNYSPMRDAARHGMRTSQDRAAFGIDPTQQGQARGQQQALADALMARANGTGGPSAAELQQQRGLDANMAQALSMAAGQRGMNAGAGLRQLAQQRAMIGSQGVNDAAQLRAQEQMGAQNQLGQLLGGMRGQDIGLASGNAQMQMANRQQNDAMTQYYMNMGFNLDQAKLAAQQALEAQYSQRYGLDRGIAVQTRAQDMQLAGAGVAAGGSLVGSLITSDERLKKDIRSAEKDTYSFLDALNASKYRYKEPDVDGDGESVSVMAQELEKTGLGKTFVVETPRGKAVNYPKGFGTLLAAQSSLHKRLKALEGGQ